MWGRLHGGVWRRLHGGVWWFDGVNRALEVVRCKVVGAVVGAGRKGVGVGRVDGEVVGTWNAS